MAGQKLKALKPHIGNDYGAVKVGDTFEVGNPEAAQHLIDGGYAQRAGKASDKKARGRTKQSGKRKTAEKQGQETINVGTYSGREPKTPPA